MDVLWSPWRYDYITNSGNERPECVFCSILKDSAPDEERFILKRAEFSFVILNIYPYTSGHLMVLPYEHASSLSRVSPEAASEMMELTRLAERAIEAAYNPDGMNIGVNLGKAAGAGVDGHVHIHVLPRWEGDVNFMTAIGQTRTIPETLQSTYEKLKTHFS